MEDKSLVFSLCYRSLHSVPHMATKVFAVAIPSPLVILAESWPVRRVSRRPSARHGLIFPLEKLLLALYIRDYEFLLSPFHSVLFPNLWHEIPGVLGLHCP